MTQKSNLCIIPARGGSKRIPRKNIKDFLGKPIIAYSIEAALKSGLFEEVVVSTDDNEIAEVAEKYYENCLSLPMYPTLTETEQMFVIETILKFYESKI
jgi:N-acylneuraminate cytidylyltransferase